MSRMQSEDENHNDRIQRLCNHLDNALNGPRPQATEGKCAPAGALPASQCMTDMRERAHAIADRRGELIERLQNLLGL
jgi:hypothetical protein